MCVPVSCCVGYLVTGLQANSGIICPAQIFQALLFLLPSIPLSILSIFSRHLPLLASCPKMKEFSTKILKQEYRENLVSWLVRYKALRRSYSLFTDVWTRNMESSRTQSEEKYIKIIQWKWRERQKQAHRETHRQQSSSDVHLLLMLNHFYEFHDVS